MRDMSFCAKPSRQRYSTYEHSKNKHKPKTPTELCPFPLEESPLICAHLPKPELLAGGLLTDPESMLPGAATGEGEASFLPSAPGLQKGPGSGIQAPALGGLGKVPLSSRTFTQNPLAPF